jgi:hypothetical protein
VATDTRLAERGEFPAVIMHRMWMYGGEFRFSAVGPAPKPAKKGARLALAAAS